MQANRRKRTADTLRRKDLLDEVRCFFFDHGHDLSDAARLIAGVPGEARVIALALRSDRATSLDDSIHRDLAALLNQPPIPTR